MSDEERDNSTHVEVSGIGEALVLVAIVVAFALFGSCNCGSCSCQGYFRQGEAMEVEG